MSFLLDTHALIYWMLDSDRLGAEARRILSGDAGRVFFSAASVFEMLYKHRIGKLPGLDPLVETMIPDIMAQGFTPLAISVEAAAPAARFPAEHRDPFDRLLAAQALTEGLTFVSNDTAVDAFGVTRIW